MPPLAERCNVGRYYCWSMLTALAATIALVSYIFHLSGQYEHGSSKHQKLLGLGIVLTEYLGLSLLLVWCYRPVPAVSVAPIPVAVALIPAPVAPIPVSVSPIPVPVEAPASQPRVHVSVDFGEGVPHPTVPIPVSVAQPPRVDGHIVAE